MVGLALLPIAIVTVFSEVTARRDFIRDSGTAQSAAGDEHRGLRRQYLDDVSGTSASWRDRRPP